MHNIKDFDFKWAGAYEEQFNVRLFNTAVRLATETTEAHKENPALLQKLAHLPWYQRVSGMDYFESREIRYFGELLERYGEKLGDDIANTRAVALAMAWTAPILTPNMFVGRQREDFILKLNLLGEGDPYIAAALYHLSEGAVKDAWRANLTVREYARTEEIILALCSMDDPEASYDDFRPALIPLLAEKRTLPVEENAGIYGWLVWSCFGAIKACRKKDNAIPKAIQALALGYLREDKPAHKALMGAGYTLLDILYLNSAFVWDGNFGGCGLSSNSIPAERLATAFVQAVLSAPEPQKASTLDYVHWLASRYTSFKVQFEGNAGLWMAVCAGLKVVCPETMVWLCDRDYSFNYRFDPLDSRWDLLAKDLPDIKYDKLFRALPGGTILPSLMNTGTNIPDPSRSWSTPVSSICGISLRGIRTINLRDLATTAWSTSGALLPAYRTERRMISGSGSSRIIPRGTSSSCSRISSFTTASMSASTATGAAASA